MTYHRTTGKGGTVNRSREPKHPNFNKKQGSDKRTKGRKVSRGK